MVLTTMTWQLVRKLGDMKAVELIKKAGFDCIDHSFFEWEQNGVFEPNYIERAKKLRAKADELNIPFVQAHAPFGLLPDKSEEESYRFTVDTTIKCLECCQILGVKIMVVHPIHNRCYYENIEYFKELNMKFYRELIPYCEKYGVKVACENMYQRNPHSNQTMPATCSYPEEFSDYIDTLNSEWIVGCLDLGHCGLTHTDAALCLRKMGSRIQALHIHDNDYLVDLHTIPYNFGKMDWEEITKALAETNYSGSFTFECDGFITPFPADEEILLAALCLLEKMGRHLIKKLESYK